MQDRDCAGQPSPTEKASLTFTSIQEKKIPHRINWVLVKTPLLLFKESTYNYHILVISFFQTLSLLCFEGAEGEKQSWELFLGLQVPSQLDTFSRQSFPPTERAQLSLFNYTSQLGSVMRGSQMNILQACSQQNRRVLPTQHYFPWHLVGEEGKKSKITTYTHLSIWNRCWGEVYYAAEN